MPIFNYVALDARGQKSTGTIEATTSNEAVGHLRQAGYFPTSIVEEGKGGAVAKPGKAVQKKAKAVAAPKAKKG